MTQFSNEHVKSCYSLALLLVRYVVIMNDVRIICAPHEKLYQETSWPLVISTTSLQFRRLIITICSSHIVIVGLHYQRTRNCISLVFLSIIPLDCYIMWIHLFGTHKVNWFLITPDNSRGSSIVKFLWGSASHTLLYKVFRKMLPVCECRTTHSGLMIV